MDDSPEPNFSMGHASYTTMLSCSVFLWEFLSLFSFGLPPPAPHPQVFLPRGATSSSHWGFSKDGGKRDGTFV